MDKGNFFIHNQEFRWFTDCFNVFELLAVVSGNEVFLGYFDSLEACKEKAKSWMGYYL